MKEELGRPGAIVGSVTLVLLFGGLALAIYPGWQVVGEFLDKNLLLTKEAPAWVQAVGSVGAILVAVWISHASDRAAARHAIINARVFASGLNSSMHAMKQSLARNQRDMVMLSNGSLHEMLLVGRGIRLELLPSSCIGAVISLRSIAGAVSIAVQTYDKDPSVAAAAKLAGVLDGFAVGLATHVVELSRAHGNIPEA